MAPVHDPALLDALEDSIDPWEGECWRYVIGTSDPLRPNSRGARWNPPGVEALYFSTSQEGAESELRSMLERQPVPTRRPLQGYKFEIRINRAVDIRSAGLDEVGFGTAAMISEDWSTPRRIGAAADWLGVAGLIVPSARHATPNLVLFVNRLEPEDEVNQIRKA